VSISSLDHKIAEDDTDNRKESEAKDSIDSYSTVASSLLSLGRQQQRRMDHTNRHIKNDLKK
jgi:hypothetical protein